MNLMRLLLFSVCLGAIIFSFTLWYVLPLEPVHLSWSKTATAGLLGIVVLLLVFFVILRFKPWRRRNRAPAEQPQQVSAGRSVGAYLRNSLLPLLFFITALLMLGLGFFRVIGRPQGIFWAVFFLLLSRLVGCRPKWSTIRLFVLKLVGGFVLWFGLLALYNKNNTLWDFSRLVGSSEWIERGVEILTHWGWGFFLAHVIYWLYRRWSKGGYHGEGGRSIFPPVVWFPIALTLMCGYFLHLGPMAFLDRGQAGPVYGRSWRSRSFVGVQVRDTVAFAQALNYEGTYTVIPNERITHTRIFLKQGDVVGFTLTKQKVRRINKIQPNRKGRPPDALFRGKPMPGFTSRDGLARNHIKPVEADGVVWWRWLEYATCMYEPLACADNGKAHSVLKHKTEWVFLEAFRDGELILMSNVPVGGQVAEPKWVNDVAMGVWRVKIYVRHCSSKPA